MELDTLEVVWVTRFPFLPSAMFKKIAPIAGLAAAFAAATPAHAQWLSFDPDNNGAEFWDNESIDGKTCNIGYLLTGVAGSPGNVCNYQRPENWLPYTGPSVNSFYNSATFTIQGGQLTVNSGVGLGGDVAGINYDWGFFTNTESGRTFTSLNSVMTFPQTYNFGASETWGFWIDNGTLRTSDVDGQFAIFRGTGGNYVVGIEDTDVPGGDRDYQDMIASVNITGTVPEPSAAVLVMSGLAGLAGVARRRKKA